MQTPDHSPHRLTAHRALCRGVSVLLVCFLTACQSLPALSPASASKRQLMATQWMQLRNDQQQFDAICLLEIVGNTMKLAVTTAQGQTLLTAELGENGSLRTTLAPWVAQSGVSPELIVRDIQIALWPLDALSQAGWQIEENALKNQRLVRLHGEKWADITYEGGLEQPTRILIQRGDKLYTVELRTLEWTKP